MAVPAGLQFTPLCGAALSQEGADLYHPGLTMSELMSDEESKEHLAGSLGVLSVHLPPTPAFGEGPGCWFSSTRQQEPTQTSHVPSIPAEPAETTPAVVQPPPDSAGAAFCLSLLPPGHSDSGGINASPSVYPGAGLTCLQLFAFVP